MKSLEDRNVYGSSEVSHLQGKRNSLRSAAGEVTNNNVVAPEATHFW